MVPAGRRTPLPWGAVDVSFLSLPGSVASAPADVPSHVLFRSVGSAEEDGWNRRVGLPRV
eukprot:scaffold614_cov378-Pavlova_lutheri.AAC.6